MVNLVIENCNCIRHADISIEPNCLNIKYGMNGTGKTTIGKAILLKAQDEQRLTSTLLPYGVNVEEQDKLPKVSNLSFQKIKVFNDGYVSQKVLAKENFFENPYMIFLNTGECDNLEAKIEELLIKLQGTIHNIDGLEELQDIFKTYFSIFKLKGNSIAKTGGVGELIKGNGSGFDKYHELDSYKPFYDKRDMKDVATWANWRREGVERVVDDQCPCCTKKLPNEIENQNTLIEKVFKKSALSTATAVLDYLKKAGDSGFVSTDAINEIENFIGDSSKASELHAALSRLGTETQYLSNKIEHIFQFRPMNVTHEQLEQIDRCLEELKISKAIIDKYYCTPAIFGLVDIVDAKVDELRANTRKLKNLFEAHEKKLNKIVEDQKEDINEFLALAGFPYEFELKPDGEKKATAYLKPSDSIVERVTNPSDHLSWGEKNAFSLVMFMFEAISEEADLIVLDDPISSFDTNKKFAVIRRMFDNKKKSFRDKTVLMLTHDLQPIIDYVKGDFFNRMGLTTQVNAKWLQNENGRIIEQDIEAADLKNVVELTHNIFKEPSYQMHVRIVNYRKYIELTVTDCSNSPAYQVLSNLIHGRPQATENDGITPLDQNCFAIGCAEIKANLDGLDYGEILSLISDENLKNQISIGDDYIKVIAFRLLFERHETIFKELRKKEPATYKFINETNHIENDYVFQLDPLKFYSIPSFYLQKLSVAVSSL